MLPETIIQTENIERQEQIKKKLKFFLICLFSIPFAGILGKLLCIFLTSATGDWDNIKSYFYIGLPIILIVIGCSYFSKNVIRDYEINQNQTRLRNSPEIF
jgi:hypothetical protein